MKFEFSENIWEILSCLWHGKKRGEELKYDDLQVKRMMRMLFLVKRAFKPVTKREYDLKRAWANVELQTKGRKRSVLPMICRYAAVLVVALSSMLFFLYQPDGGRDSLVMLSGDTISSGMRKAELLLANGERVILDAQTGLKEVQALGIKFVNSNGELHYEALGEEDTSRLSYNILSVPKGGEYTLILPDGSRVWLNSESSLRFPVRFMKGQRDVYLIGEAYFEVAKNAQAPFHVRVSDCDIRVLGTSFNVSAYPEDRIWQTTLVEGRVQVENAGGQLIMKPSEQYTMDRETGKSELSVVDTELYTSWVDGKFYFNTYAFEDIVKKLERWYDFTMVYQDESIRYMCFSGTINKHRPLSEMLQYLEKTTDIHFEISGKVITVSKIKKG